MDRHCKNCKYWDYPHKEIWDEAMQDGYPVLGRCAQLSSIVDEGLGMMFIQTLLIGTGEMHITGVSTGSEFGCVQFESKE